MKWDIIPINTGALRSHHENLVYGAPVETVKIPCIVWILKSRETGEVILVDAGPTDDQAWATKYHVPLEREAGQTLEEELVRHGLKPDDIRTVLVTHLHWDHAYGLLKLKNAEIIVQRREIQYAVAAEPIVEAKRFEADIKTTLPYFLQCWPQMTFIDGDAEIRPGLKAVFLPGHSPGSMGVLIDTAQGPYLMPADLINLEENWIDRKICGAGTSLDEARDSLAKVERIVADTGAVVLPSHDFVAFELLKDFIQQ